MNSATKFLVMILFIGVLCTDVGARKLDKVSKEFMDQKSFMFPPMPSTLPTPVVPPVPLPEPISGLGEAVSATKDTKLGISIPKTAATNGVGTELVIIVKKTSGTVTVNGPNPSAYSKSIADRQAGADAEAGPDGAKSNGSSSGYAYTNAGGSTSNSNP
ncbi:hypothetical protein HID58_085398 [Brassica napus]|uniref:Uncharacterized protein n=1 Tax=Brassica napus TaxID=3708 RepID=A0ABQ7XMH6_BRANA|nr:uncharacterized protein LOC125592462 [Brassica napus]KAH0857137.1 hypothetical protein HID58_085398 [Brassica napus]